MAHVTVSRDYRIVIPKEIRERIPISPGQELWVTAGDGVIRLVPVPTLEQLRGIARSARAANVREKVDRRPG